MTTQAELLDRAIDGSIEKWQKIVDGVDEDDGSKNCPLCALFDDECCGCPIAAEFGDDCCWGSPYGDWIKLTDHDVIRTMHRRVRTLAQKDAAQAMLEYLVELKAKRKEAADA